MFIPRSVVLTEDDKLIIIDQTLLPGKLEFTEIKDRPQMLEAIKKLQVRGAPAIGVFAAYCVYILALRYRDMLRVDMIPALRADIARLGAARPTAVNLVWALGRMEEALRMSAAAPTEEIIAALRKAAVAIDEQDQSICRAIGQAGAPLIKEGMGLLTHCNAGSLATSFLGTALAPMYVAAEEGRRFRVYCDETRPLLQGARLTAWELAQAGLEPTVICDNAAAWLMDQGKIDMVLVGADRIAANGDTANKIGTLAVAVLAKHFGIPFYVCAPGSTFDRNTPTGAEMIIEQRDAAEVSSLWYSRPMVPEEAQVLNPAFDITPAELITGYITNEGIKQKADIGDSIFYY